MAIATVERDSTRGSGASEPRFKLVEDICRTGDMVFWRAVDRRSGKACVVRVIDAGREESSRRLGELHRERLLAERIAHSAVLRPDVPLIEADRIYQLVQPEPARRIEGAEEEGRLALLGLLATAAAALAEGHARGAFHGALTRDSLLRSAEGRLILQGFTGDAANAVAARDGAAGDHHAFLALAQELLAPTGGPPPRLRRYFARELAPGAPRPAAGAMAALADELRDSLEDTFPWPLAAAPASAASDDGTARLPVLSLEPEPAGMSGARFVSAAAPTMPKSPARQPVAAPTALPMPAAPGKPAVAPSAMVPVAPAAKVAPATAAPAAPVTAPAPKTESAAATAPVVVQPQVSSAAAGGYHKPKGSAAVIETLSSPPLSAAAPDAARPAPVAPAVSAAVRTATQAARHERVTSATPHRAAPVAGADAGDAAAPPQVSSGTDARSGLRRWLAVAVLLAVLIAGWLYGQRRHAAESSAPSPPAATSAASQALPSPMAAPDAVVPRAAVAAPATAVRPDREGAAPSTAMPGIASTPVAPPLAADPPAAALADGQAAASRSVRRIASPPVVSPTATREAAAERAREANEAQARRSRVASLVAGGTRALNALEPQLAAEAFAQALALAPQDRAAIEGSQRARRLLGAAALVRDAREAAARGDHARAVQGYSQALANDPRNRGLAEALGVSRRSLARDESGALLAAGHEALGAGRLEQARDAFERALQIDPLDTTARRAAEQAATAILLRDAANERRLAANPTGG